jgi:excisionase family DNA binding protein
MLNILGNLLQNKEQCAKLKEHQKTKERRDLMQSRHEWLDETTLLTVDEMAALLRISRTKSYEICRQSDFPGVIRIGRSIRILKSQLMDWLQEQ